MEVLKLFAPYGPAWLGGVLLTLVAFYFGRQFLEEYKRQNQRKGELDLKREERKQAEVDERAQRDREPVPNGGAHRRPDGAQQHPD